MIKPRISSYVLIALSATLLSCTSVEQIGRVNMISNRNIDSDMDYKMIATYSGGSKKELKKARAVTIEDAIDETVRTVPGGEFLMNAKIYIVNETYFAVEGDVWGLHKVEKSHRGFRVGSKVLWKNQSLASSLGLKSDFVEATVKALKDDKTCFIEIEQNQSIEEVSYEEITIID